MPGMEQPIKYWVPSIAPSGMAFYTGELFPAWKGNLFVGALAGQMLVRLTLDGEKVTGEERLLQGMRERIRDVRVGPDGAIYLVTDNNAGRILQGHSGEVTAAPAHAAATSPAIGLTLSLPGNTAAASARSSTRRWSAAGP